VLVRIGIKNRAHSSATAAVNSTSIETLHTQTKDKLSGVNQSCIQNRGAHRTTRELKEKSDGELKKKKSAAIPIKKKGAAAREKKKEKQQLPREQKNTSHGTKTPAAPYTSFLVEGQMEPKAAPF
jgi:hypothetical protein